MESKSCFEVAIVGGGLVGAALARALRGESVALVAPLTPPPDARVYALSPGNADFLRHLGIWDALPPGKLTPVHAMRVFGDDGAACIEFDAQAAGVAELAWIVEEGAILESLSRALEGQEGLARFDSASIKGLEAGVDRAALVLDNGQEIQSRLVVGADGARSAVRERAGIAAHSHSYGQAALVANFACGRPHRHVAWQWFCHDDDGVSVLALLPLPGERVSMVWSLAEAEARRLVALDASALAAEVERTAQGALGAMQLVSVPRQFPLQRLAAPRLVAARIALAGDAAHVVHPLAGQGANLGLQDAQALAAVLVGREPLRDPGDVRLLRRYERSRAEAILQMRTVVHGLYRLFDARGATAARLRNAGLNFADRVPVLKNLLMRHAMG